MRYFVHVRKTVAYATLQLSRAVLTHLRGGRTDGEIRVRGVSLYARGFGWYRIYGDVAQRGLDLMSTINFLSVRIKNMALKRLSVSDADTSSMFAFKEGFFSPAILSVRRVLKVTYDTVRGHRTPRVINRAHQASAGFAEYMSATLGALHQKSVSANKLDALVAKFSH